MFRRSSQEAGRNNLSEDSNMSRLQAFPPRRIMPQRSCSNLLSANSANLRQCLVPVRPWRIREDSRMAPVYSLRALRLCEIFHLVSFSRQDAKHAKGCLLILWLGWSRSTSQTRASRIHIEIPLILLILSILSLSGSLHA